MSKREKWQAKSFVEERAKGNKTGRSLINPEEDLLQNVKSLAISQDKIPVQNQQRQKKSYPDDWVDEYVSGQDQLTTSKAEKDSQGSIQLECYDGSPIEWFCWIGLYQALVHDTGKRTAKN